MENCVISRTVFYVDDKSEIRFKLSSILLEKIDIEKSGNLMMGQLCGSIVADRHTCTMCSNLSASKMRASPLHMIDIKNYQEVNR